MPRHVSPNWSYPLGTAPRENESLVGYCDRLARRMGMPGVNSLFRLAGITVTNNRIAPDNLEALAALTRTEVRTLALTTYGFPGGSHSLRGLVIPSGLFRTDFPSRVACPACLSESAHHRIWWDLAVISACPVHGRLLLGTCPFCRKPLRWWGGCTCGDQVFAGAATDGVPDEELVATAAVHGLLGDARFREQARQARRLEPFADLAPGDIVEFIARMGVDPTAPASGSFSLKAKGKLGDMAHLTLRFGLQVALGWPEAFHRALADMHDLQSRQGSDEPRVAIHVGRWLDKLAPGQGQAIRAQLQVFSKEHDRRRSWKSRRGR